MSEQNFEIISSFSFCTLCIFGYDLRMPTPIQVKLSTHKGLYKAQLHTNFGSNPIKMYIVMINFFVQKRSKIYHAYMVNWGMELDKTWHVSGVTIVRVPFCGLKRIWEKITEV